MKLAGTVITDMNHVKEETARMLYGTFDGNGLSSHVAVPLIHSWVSDGTKITYGSKLAVRGRTSRDPRCSMCKDYEALGHILQTCARTWAQRNERHNTLVDKVVTILKRNKFEVQVKPRIPTSAGVKKPNIVAWLKRIFGCGDWCNQVRQSLRGSSNLAVISGMRTGPILLWPERWLVVVVEFG